MTEFVEFFGTAIGVAVVVAALAGLALNQLIKSDSANRLK